MLLHSDVSMGEGDVGEGEVVRVLNVDRRFIK
jgi:hypothetical protein